VTVQIDTMMMRRALALGAAARGTTAPNPAIGCVIAKHNHILGEGVTQPGGRPHAEAMALAAAGTEARGATLYVTLEPCAHVGRSPPCADAIVSAGIRRVVVAMAFDPDPRVSGRGLEKLRGAGIAVETGLLCEQARDTLAGFLCRMTRRRALSCFLFHDKVAVPQDNADDGLKAMRANHDLVLSATLRCGQDEAWPPHFLLRSTPDGAPLVLRTLHDTLRARPAPAGAFTRLDDLLAHLGSLGYNDVLIEAGRSVMADLAVDHGASTQATSAGEFPDAPSAVSDPLAREALTGVRQSSAAGSRS
jgi:pyrimidine deaminase RibD-like protein